MNSTRNKRLLACFLSVIGLNTCGFSFNDKVHASYSYSYKANEKRQLNDMFASDIKKLLDSNDLNDKISIRKIYLKLLNALNTIYDNRHPEENNLEDDPEDVDECSSRLQKQDKGNKTHTEIIVSRLKDSMSENGLDKKTIENEIERVRKFKSYNYFEEEFDEKNDKSNFLNKENLELVRDFIDKKIIGLRGGHFTIWTNDVRSAVVLLRNCIDNLINGKSIYDISNKKSKQNANSAKKEKNDSNLNNINKNLIISSNDNKNNFKNASEADNILSNKINSSNECKKSTNVVSESVKPKENDLNNIDKNLIINSNNNKNDSKKDNHKIKEKIKDNKEIVKKAMNNNQVAIEYGNKRYYLVLEQPNLDIFKKCIKAIDFANRINNIECDLKNFFDNDNIKSYILTDNFGNKYKLNTQSIEDLKDRKNKISIIDIHNPKFIIQPVEPELSLRKSLDNFKIY